jgi:arabinogalactan oligomer/maltooligosaccharide transport system substrate-binding protein
MGIMRTLVAGSAVAAVTVTGIALAPAAQAAKSITVWADASHAAVISELTKNGYDGLKVTVVVKDPTTMGADLSAATPADAPDVIWGDLASTGELAQAGLVVPVELKKKRAGMFRENVMAGNIVGGKHMGVPVQISNLALVTNTTLVPKQPTTMDELSKLALGMKKKGTVKVALGIPQGEGSNGVNLFPLFQGLGGYLYGTTADGSLDPKDVGLMNKKFKGKASQIDGWNSSGLIDSSLTPDRAAKLFAKTKSAFWVAGPEDLPALMKLSFVYRIGALPPVVAGQKSRPLLTIHGLMVTSFAEKHGVLDQATALATQEMTKVGPQLKLAAASGWFPANTKAAAQVETGGGRVRAIGNAGADGVAMPNIPQARTLWGPYGTAWFSSTSGASATPAAQAFQIAEKAVRKAGRD